MTVVGVGGLAISLAVFLEVVVAVASEDVARPPETATIHSASEMTNLFMGAADYHNRTGLSSGPPQSHASSRLNPRGWLDYSPAESAQRKSSSFAYQRC